MRQIRLKSFDCTLGVIFLTDRILFVFGTRKDMVMVFRESMETEA